MSYYNTGAVFGFLFFILSGSFPVTANVNGIPALAAISKASGGTYCYGSGVSKGTNAGHDYCWFTSSRKPALFDPQNYFSPEYVVSLREEFKSSYVPYAGKYRLREHICYATSQGWCSISKGVLTQESASAVSLNTAEAINSQDPNFGGGTSKLSPASSFTLCLTLVDDTGHEWRTNEPITCADADALPENPSTCYLNYGSELNIDMGTIERGKIATKPALGSVGNVKKNLSVLCTRDAGVTVSTSFKFTAITVSGSEVISTSSSNLGIAIFYQNTLVGSSSTPITETFEAGYTDRELEFQVVRDPNVKLGDIPTGEFTASAVMIMTER